MSVPELSEIEKQVALLVAGGQSHRAIADEFGLSVKTIEWHANRARHKLGRVAALHGRFEANADGRGSGGSDPTLRQLGETAVTTATDEGGTT